MEPSEIRERLDRISERFKFGGFILRDAMLRMAPQDEVLNPHGEERGNAARLETRGRVIRIHDCGQAEWAPSIPGFRGACHRAALRADPLAPSGLRRCLKIEASAVAASNTHVVPANAGTQRERNCAHRDAAASR